MAAFLMQGGVGMVNFNSSHSFAPCGLCQGTDHPTTNCPLSFEEEPLYEEANAVSGNYGPNNNPYSNTYNPGWRNHPNFSWRNNQPLLGQGSGQPQYQNFQNNTNRGYGNRQF